MCGDVTGGMIWPHIPRKDDFVQERRLATGGQVVDEYWTDARPADLLRSRLAKRAHGGSCRLGYRRPPFLPNAEEFWGRYAIWRRQPHGRPRRKRSAARSDGAPPPPPSRRWRAAPHLGRATSPARRLRS